MKNPLFQNSSPFLKLIFFFFIILGSFIIILTIGTIFAVPIFGINFSDFASYLDIKNPNNIPFIKFMQAIQHMGMYLFPPLIAAFVYSKKPSVYLKSNTYPSIFLFITTLVIVLAAIPLSSYLGSLNSQMSLPESLSGLENKLKLMEEKAMEATLIFLNVDSVKGLLINLFIVAVLPALGEEFFFRGILQKLFKDWTGNIHISIFITAAVFSAVHMQFFTFLPRFMLGMLFGYLLFWSKSIWVPIFAHFVNNAVSVIVFYFSENAGSFEQTETELMEPSAIIPSLLLFAGALYLFYSYFKKEKPISQL